jgi:hypothetical protein
VNGQKISATLKSLFVVLTFTLPVLEAPELLVIDKQAIALNTLGSPRKISVSVVSVIFLTDFETVATTPEELTFLMSADTKIPLLPFDPMTTEYDCPSQTLPPPPQALVNVELSKVNWVELTTVTAQ